MPRAKSLHTSTDWLKEEEEQEDSTRTIVGEASIHHKLALSTFNQLQL